MSRYDVSYIERLANSSLNYESADYHLRVPQTGVDCLIAGATERRVDLLATTRSSLESAAPGKRHCCRGKWQIVIHKAEVSSNSALQNVNEIREKLRKGLDTLKATIGSQTKISKDEVYVS